ncbi:hypothetical protein, partial [Micromonospora andamanensis]|uniref:hypothetical protein n=1 Tax=Micromonospora andamanensis TaxID=1287068 RepID=UPI00363153B6
NQTHSPASPGIKQTWHWLIKHPVEFSKNNHTPNLASLENRVRGNRSKLSEPRFEVNLKFQDSRN